ncbi:MAG: hypothetical protein JJU28_22880 [Cyclobacteriaceae bacterium]|nr:hypothetical protein [Cyclobacteriaceae bacterium]
MFRYKYSMLFVLTPAFLLSALFLIACGGKNYSECGDPFALNYNAESTGKTGCNYPELNLEPEKLSTLPAKVKETSGLAIIQDKLITHNDRGNSNHLFVIDRTNGQVLQRITVNGAENVDWEDLAESREHLFIGDMGNNNGDRRDLKIYMVHKDAFNFSGDGTVEVSGIIEFVYPDQTNFSSSKNHNYDCEAIIYKEGHIYLFSKNRLNNQSDLYRIPATPGTYQAEFIDSFETRGLITGADIQPGGHQITLLGYRKNGDCFLWVLESYQEDNFFSGAKKYVRLGRFGQIGQTEGIVYKDDSSYYISSEKVDGLNPRLYRLRK